MSIAAQSTQASLHDFTEGKTVNRKLEQLEKPHTDAQVLHYLYWECRMSLPQIADKLGIASARTIWKWMRRHGIERRTKVEGKRIREIRDGPFSRQSDNTSGSGETDSSTESKWSFQD